MYVKRAAEIVGIDAKALRDFIRRNPALVNPVGGGRVYDLTLDQVELLKTAYWEGLSDRRTQTDSWADGSDHKGLPLSALHDPAMRQQFEQLRRERRARLDVLLRASGQSVPQMTARQLSSNGRALSTEAINPRVAV